MCAVRIVRTGRVRRRDVGRFTHTWRSFLGRDTAQPKTASLARFRSSFSLRNRSSLSSWMVFFRRFAAGGVSLARVVSPGPCFEHGSVLPAPSRPRRRPAGSAGASSIKNEDSSPFAFRFRLCAYHGASARARPPSLWDSSSIFAASASRFAASSSARSSSANRLTCPEARDWLSEFRFRARSVSIASLPRAPASSRAFASARSSSRATRWRCFHPYGFQLLCGRMFSPPWPPSDATRRVRSRARRRAVNELETMRRNFNETADFLRRTAAGGPSHSSARPLAPRPTRRAHAPGSPPTALASYLPAREAQGPPHETSQAARHHEAPHPQHGSPRTSRCALFGRGPLSRRWRHRAAPSLAARARSSPTSAAFLTLLDPPASFSPPLRQGTTSGFPLRIEVLRKEAREAEFHAEFLVNTLGKIEWDALARRGARDRRGRRVARE